MGFLQERLLQKEFSDFYFIEIGFGLNSQWS